MQITVHGSKRRGLMCDGIARRDFLTIGALGMGGLSMPQLLRAESQAGIGSSSKSVIMIYLAGGPSHQDMFDLKMDAPEGVRGEFKPISSNLPHVQICEHMPRIAQRMDRLVTIRSLIGSFGNHDGYQCLSGFSKTDARTLGRPCLGAFSSKLCGLRQSGVPPFVGLMPPTRAIEWDNPGRPGFLGQAHAAFNPFDGGKADLMLRDISLEQLGNRRRLLESFDVWQRKFESSGALDGLDAFQHQAFNVLTSNKLLNALDLEQEDPKVRERYGRASTKPMVDGPPLANQNFLIARRLVEAGVRCVTLSFGRWDTHAGLEHDKVSNFETLRTQLLPRLDLALPALLDDLHERGLEQDVSVVVWGEFGRTPQINERGGRDHWPRVGMALLAGGAMRTGQVIGSTDRLGGEAVDRPVHFQEVFATLYHCLGIKLHETVVHDSFGRPQRLVDSCYQPIHEVV